MDNFKKIFVSITTAITSFFGVLFIPVMLLVGSNILDYGTGILASPKRGQAVDSAKGSKGIRKKVGMWVLVLIGGMVDVFLEYSGNMIGITMVFKFPISSAVALWLTVNEWISILENLKDIGTPLPPFLLPILNSLKSQVENQVDVKEESEEEKHE